METVPLRSRTSETNVYSTKSDFKYKFKLKPIYEIAHVRKNSAAANIGLQKGDILLKVNSSATYKYSLENINSMFRSEGLKWITLEVERDNQVLKFRFKLDDIL